MIFDNEYAIKNILQKKSRAIFHTHSVCVDLISVGSFLFNIILGRI